MLTLLFKLNTLDIKRNSRISALYCFLYIFVFYCVSILYFDWVYGEQIKMFIKVSNIWQYVVLLSTCFILVDFIVKLLFKFDTILINDCIKTKPIPNRYWNRMILLKSFMMPMNLLCVALLLPLCVLYLTLSYSVVLLLSVYSVSLVNSWIVTDMRSVKGNLKKVCFLLFEVFYIAGMYLLATKTENLDSTLQISTFHAVNIIIIVCLYCLMATFENYNENNVKHINATSVSIFSLNLQWISALRAKRIRIVVLWTLIVGIGFIYWMAFYEYAGREPAWDGYIISQIQLFMCMTTLGINIFGIGVEANYYGIINTMPLSMKQILKEKYYLSMVVGLIFAVALIPIFVVKNYSFFYLLSVLIYVVGFSNIVGLWTGVYSERFDLFDSPIFNYQGGLAKINIKTLCLFLPLIIGTAIIIMTPDIGIATIILFGIGLVGLLFHRIFIALFDRIYAKQKHNIISKYDN